MKRGAGELAFTCAQRVFNNPGEYYPNLSLPEFQESVRGAAGDGWFSAEETSGVVALFRFLPDSDRSAAVVWATEQGSPITGLADDLASAMSL